MQFKLSKTVRFNTLMILSNMLINSILFLQNKNPLNKKKKMSLRLMLLTYKTNNRLTINLEPLKNKKVN